MGEIKTRPTDLDVDSFLMSVEPAKKRMVKFFFPYSIFQSLIKLHCRIILLNGKRSLCITIGP
jgi:hypothetical protein